MTKIDLPPKRTVGHLTLLRESRALTSKEFNALSSDERLEMVRAAPGRRKYELLIEAVDAADLVPALPAQEIFLLVKEFGPDDVADLVQLASAEQLTAFLDLDCWQGDHLDPGAVRTWFFPMLEGDEETLLHTVQQVDFELMVLLLKKFCQVVHGPEAYLDDDARQEAVAKDGGYRLDFSESEDAKALGGLLDAIRRREPEYFQHLLEAVRWEQMAGLEEECYRMRSIRLLELGFPDPVEAASLFSCLDPDRFDPITQRKLPVLPGGENAGAPAFVLAPGGAKDLLAEVFAGGITSEACWELTYLVNKFMVAEKIDVGDVVQVREAMADVNRYLNLGLEKYAGSDVKQAAAMMEKAYLEHLFRAGFSLTLNLRERARKILDSPIGAYLDGPFRSLVRALDQPRPKLFKGVEARELGGERPFGSLHDLRLAEEWLDRLEIQRRLMAERLPFPLPEPAELDLVGCVPEDAADICLADFFLTALANRVTGGPFVPRPIPQEELPALHAQICADGELLPDLRKETVKWADSLEPGAGHYADFCLDQWEEGICPVSPERLDVRFLSGLIIRQA